MLVCERIEDNVIESSCSDDHFIPPNTLIETVQQRFEAIRSYLESKYLLHSIFTLFQFYARACIYHSRLV